MINGYFPQGESRDHEVKFPAKRKFYADLLAYLLAQEQLDPANCRMIGDRKHDMLGGRANGIAARPIGGYVCPQSGVLKARDYHNWGEFYENGIWQLADPQNRVLMRNAADYIAMRIIHGSEDGPMGPYNRFRFKGEGLEVKMN